MYESMPSPRASFVGIELRHQIYALVIKEFGYRRSRREIVSACHQTRLEALLTLLKGWHYFTLEEFRT